MRALAFQRFSAYLAKSRDFQDACKRHLEFGTSQPRDYELLYGRGWMERVTTDAQGSEIERYTSHIVRAGVDDRGGPAFGATGEDQMRPACRQRLRGDAANAGVGAGDDDVLSREVHD